MEGERGAALWALGVRGAPLCGLGVRKSCVASCVEFKIGKMQQLETKRLQD